MLPDRFWAKVDKSGDCWVWTANRDHRGYGRYNAGSHTFRQAHRLAYEDAYGPIPEGAWVLHRCDDRACVNPNHLFLGDHQANMDDMVAKGRSARGQLAQANVLTAEQVLLLVAELDEGVPWSAVASNFGVSKSCVQHISSGANWSWLTGRGAHRRGAD